MAAYPSHLSAEEATHVADYLAWKLRTSDIGGIDFDTPHLNRCYQWVLERYGTDAERDRECEDVLIRATGSKGVPYRFIADRIRTLSRLRDEYNQVLARALHTRFPDLPEQPTLARARIAIMHLHPEYPPLDEALERIGFPDSVMSNA